jgi:hypothetical protein
MLALMAMVVVSAAFPAMAYHNDGCWAYDEDYGWYYWCDDDDWYDDYDDYGYDCWEWSAVFEEWQWDCD